MHATFTETTHFTAWVTKYLTDDVLSELQQALIANPEAGDVIPGCGGLRKIRVSDPRRGKGKRSGNRVIYLYIPKAKRFFLLDIYGKDDEEALAVQEKSLLAKMAEQLRQEARFASSRRRRG